MWELTSVGQFSLFKEPTSFKKDEEDKVRKRTSGTQKNWRISFEPQPVVPIELVLIPNWGFRKMKKIGQKPTPNC